MDEATIQKRRPAFARLAKLINRRPWPTQSTRDTIISDKDYLLTDNNSHLFLRALPPSSAGLRWVATDYAQQTARHVVA